MDSYQWGVGGSVGGNVGTQGGGAVGAMVVSYAYRMVCGRDCERVLFWVDWKGLSWIGMGDCWGFVRSFVRSLLLMGWSRSRCLV